MANVAGRLLWGPLSDKIGKTGTLVLINLLLIACLLGLLLLSSEALFTAALLGVILCFGGTASLVAPLTADLFGNCHVGENYSVMFCVFGTSSLVGPPLISAIRDFTGNYTAAYFFALGFALISLVISLFLFRASRKAASAS
jgi:OFA family oxalate/formate antiporter-like MFS transporter